MNHVEQEEILQKPVCIEDALSVVDDAVIDLKTLQVPLFNNKSCAILFLPRQEFYIAVENTSKNIQNNNLQFWRYRNQENLSSLPNCEEILEQP